MRVRLRLPDPRPLAVFLCLAVAFGALFFTRQSVMDNRVVLTEQVVLIEDLRRDQRVLVDIVRRQNARLEALGAAPENGHLESVGAQGPRGRPAPSPTPTVAPPPSTTAVPPPSTAPSTTTTTTAPGLLDGLLP